MIASKSLKTSLQNTTALIGAAFLATHATEAMAATTTINNTGNSTVTLGGAGDNLIVTFGGAIDSATTMGVLVNGGTANMAGTIDNSGTISGGPTTGILVMSTSTVSNGITNSGTINGLGDTSGTSGYGIKLQSGSTVNGGINNTGSILGGAGTVTTSGYGIYMVSNSLVTGGINNTGTLAVISGGDTGIYLSGSHVTGGIHNEGTISGANDTGIELDSGSSVSGGITNSGFILGGDTAINVHSGSSISGNIDNTGSITGGNTGIRLDSGSDLFGAIVNSDTGTIAGTNGSGGGSYGIWLDSGSSITGGIDNAGTIQGGSDGITIEDSSTIFGGIVNSGTIAGFYSYTSGSSTFSGGRYGIDLNNNSNITGGIDNSGTISGDNTGLRLTGGSSIDGVIENSGQITGGDTGIYLDPSYINDGILNTAGVDGDSNTEDDAVISGGTDGILVKDGSIIADGASDFAIENAGQITGGTGAGIRVTGYTGTTATGVLTGTASAITGTINNTGTISGDTRGIAVSTFGQIAGGSGTAPAIWNHDTGVISTMGTSSGSGYGRGINLWNHASIAGAIAGVVNTGTIQGSEDGIHVSDNSTVTGVFASIYNRNVIDGVDGSGIDVESGSSITNGIWNAVGFTTASSDVAVHGSITGGTYGINVNNGIIGAGIINDADGDNIALISGGDTGIQMSNGDITGTIENGGTISGGSVGINLQNGSTVTGEINNDEGTIEATGSSGTAILVSASQVSGGITTTGTIEGDAYAIYMNNMTGNMIIDIAGGDNTTHVIGDVYDDEYDSTGTDAVVTVSADHFTTEGSFWVSNLTVDDGSVLTISPDNEITLNTMGDSDGGTFDFGITTAADGEHGKITVDNDNANFWDATITATVSATTHLADGDEILIATGDDTVVANYYDNGDIVDDNSLLLWDFATYFGDDASITSSDSDNDLFLVAVSTIGTVPGITQNEINAGKVLEGLTPPIDAGLQGVLDNLAAADVAGDTDLLTDTLESVLPTVDGGAAEGAFDVGAETQYIADTRIASIRNGDGTTGMAAGASANGATMWAQGYGRWASQDARDTVAGYDSDTLGGAVGFDSTNLVNGSVVGIMFNYGKDNIDSKNINTTSTDVDNYGVNIFSSTDVGQQMFVNAQVGYAYNKINSDRHNVNLLANNTAHADYHSDLWSAKLGLGRDYAADGTLTLTPILSAAYSYLDTGSYTENGSTADLHVNSDNTSALNLGFGVTAAWNLKGANGTVKPTLHAGYAYDAVGDHVSTSSSFVADPLGDVFITNGASAERSTFNGGAGISYLSNANWDLSANYDYKYKQDYAAHSGVLRATTHF